MQATWDVFISYSGKDQAVVRAVAERLRADGLKVWFDAWEIAVGDSIPAKLEEGLEHSRVLVLCMSANAFGSDWARLESGTFRFRDPLNKDRRFVPLRLDDQPAPGSLAQFHYVDWREGKRDGEYAVLLAACRPPALVVEPSGEAAAAAPGVRLVSLGHTDGARSVAMSPDGKHGWLPDFTSPCQKPGFPQRAEASGLILPVPGGSSYKVTYAADPDSGGPSLLAVAWIPKDQAVVPTPQSTSIAAGASGSIQGRVPAAKDARWLEILLGLTDGTGSGTLTLMVDRSIHTQKKLTADTAWKALVRP